MTIELPDSPWKAWLVLAAVFMAAAFFWWMSQVLSLPIQPLDHSHSTEAEHSTEKYQ